MVNSRSRSSRRRLSVQERLEQLVDVGVDLIATQSWDTLTMADIAATAGVSKPLLYHYFSTKHDLYLAAVSSAAKELRRATRPQAGIAGEEQVSRSLGAHVDWVEANALAYRAVMSGGANGDPRVRAIVERSRTEVFERVSHHFDITDPSPAVRIALRGWIGFLEAACLDWLRHKGIAKAELVRLLAASLPSALAAADNCAEDGR